ncbi:MAG: 50S ribosomal protein L23 [Chloroflexi bacterium]|nr:50S ribosomal protein L23 [Chloroflexota bacterium]
MHVYEVIRRPLVTEKSTRLGELGKYVFEVDRRATKAEIKQAVERIFTVHVRKVNVLNVPGKPRRVRQDRGYTAAWRKAIVSLQPGERITLFEGV